MGKYADANYGRKAALRAMRKAYRARRRERAQKAIPAAHPSHSTGQCEPNWPNTTSAPDTLPPQTPVE